MNNQPVIGHPSIAMPSFAMFMLAVGVAGLYDKGTALLVTMAIETLPIITMAGPKTGARMVHTRCTNYEAVRLDRRFVTEDHESVGVDFTRVYAPSRSDQLARLRNDAGAGQESHSLR